MRRVLVLVLVALVLSTPVLAQDQPQAQPAAVQAGAPLGTTAAVPPGTTAAVPPGTTAAAPSETKTGTKAGWLEYHDQYVGEQNDIANPHRTTEEVLAYAQQLVIDGLTLGPEDFNQHVVDMKKMFTDEGWGGYAAYLKESRLADMVRVDQYKVNTIINGNSLVAGQGAVDGIYAWQVQAPVMMTFLQKDATGQLREINTGRFRIAVALTRSLKAPNPEGLLISSWKVETSSVAE